MILNTLKNFLLIGVLFVATSNGQNSFTGPGLRGSNGTTNGSYPINNTNVFFVPQSSLIGQNSTSGPAPRGSNGTTNGSYPINNTNVAVVPQSVLINYTRVCDYPTDTIIALRYTYD
jgi:hypothetical protein